VCIVYDPSRSAKQGTFSLKALRLTDRFYEIHKAGEFTFEKIADKSLSWSEIVTETPVTVRNSALAAAVFGELTASTLREEESGVVQSDLDRLHMSTNPFLERSLEFLSECMDDLASEQQKVAFYQRNVSRQQLQQAQWLQKRKQENAQRKASGLEALPEEDENAAKGVTEPSRLEGFLIANQVNQYVDQIQEFGQASLQKLYLVSGTQGVDNIAPRTPE
jgi:translation initiation factor 3 subunit H